MVLIPLARTQGDSGIEPPMFRANRIALANSEIAVSERGNHRIVRLRRDLSVVSSFGREGGGPSEFRGPDDVLFWNDRIVVSDVANARISFFTSTGELQGSVTMPTTGLDIGQFAISSSGAVFVASPSESHYLLVSRDGETWQPFGDRITAQTGSRRGADPWAGMPRMDLIEATSTDTLYVLDNREGVLVTLLPDAGVVSRRLVPRALLEELRSREATIAHGFGGSQQVYAPLFKSMSVGDDGRVFLLFVVGDTVGAILE